jgi:DNA repair exonuclease SbcCD ATPase subunit
LDDAGIESCNRLLVSLKRYFRTLLIITHVDAVKDVTDQIIEVTKDEKDAHVSVE